MTDSSGALLGINRYDEYGQPQSTNLGSWGYTGQAWLPNLNVWYYKARMYESEAGRFLQTDPIGYAGDGPNLYAYVLNDPVNFIDPLGLQQICTQVPKEDTDRCAVAEPPDAVVIGIRIPTYDWGRDIVDPFDNLLGLDPIGGISIVSGLTTEGNRQCRISPVLNVLGKLWGGVNTVLGLGIAGVSWGAGKLLGTNPSFTTGNNAIQLLNSPLVIGGRAFTVGNVQVYPVGRAPDASDFSYTGRFVEIGRHEEAHTIQSQILGPFYLPLQGLGLLLGNDNPADVAADKYAARETCKVL